MDDDYIDENINIFNENINDEDETLHDSFTMFIENLSQYDLKRVNLFTNESFDIIDTCINESFIRIYNKDHEDIFNILKKTKAYRFSSLLCLIKSRINNKILIDVVVAYIGMWLSANYIQKSSHIKQRVIVRAFCLMWPYVRGYESGNFEIWKPKHGWVMIQVNEATSYIISRSSHLLYDIENNTDYWKDISSELDIKYNISWLGRQMVKNKPQHLEDISLSDDGIIINTENPNEDITTNTILSYVNWVKSNESVDIVSFDRDMLSNDINNEKFNNNYSIYKVDDTSKNNEYTSLRSIRFTNDKVLVFEKLQKNSIVDIKQYQYQMVPGLLNISISLTKLEYDLDSINKAKEYINRTFYTKELKDLFEFMCMATLLKENFKKVLFLVGLTGDEGKSTIIDIVSKSFGNSKVLMSAAINGIGQQKGSEHTAHLEGIERASFISVPEIGNKPLNEENTKLLASGDEIVHRNSGSSISKQIIIKGVSCGQSNHLPTISPYSTYALLKRLVIINLDIIFIDKNVYKSKAISNCLKCKSYYSNENNPIIHCEHKNKYYLESGKYKYNIRSDILDINKIRQGIVYLTVKKYENEGTSIFNNVRSIVDSIHQIRYRWIIFIRSYKMKYIMEEYTISEVEEYTDNIKSMINFIKFNKTWIKRLKNEIKSSNKYKQTGTFNNYIKTIDGFIGSCYNDELKSMLLNVFKAETCIS